MSGLKPYIEDVVEAAKASDKEDLTRACEALKQQLPVQPRPIAEADARRVLRELRSARHYREMRQMAEAFIRDGCADPTVERQLGQALIEEGSISSAVAVLERLLGRLEPGDPEFGEAVGLLGRAWKQTFVETAESRSEFREKAFEESVRRYRQAYDLDRERNIWQGVNLAAMLSMGNRLKANAAWKREAREVSKEIIETVEDIPVRKRTPWDAATAAEAAIALGRMEEAADWLHLYVRDRDTTAFQLGGTLRQLTEVWGLSLEGEGSDLIGPLQARLLQLPGGDMRVNPRELQRISEIPEDSYERVLGSIGPKTHSWMQRATARAESVALIRHNGRGIGTGFAISGSLVRDDYADQLLVLTNSHVISDPPYGHAVRPEDATVTFELKNQESGSSKEYEIAEIVWSSPPDQHDAAILRLQPGLTEETVAPMPIAGNLPTLTKTPPQRVYIIGHPGGGEISYSLNDNELLDYERPDAVSEPITRPIRVQYRAPTEPGSSGSPVFNAGLKVIALHHAGGRLMPRLNGEPGTHAANEGLWVRPIFGASRG